MRRKWLLFPLIVALLLPAAIRADYLKVSRPATLKAQPKAKAIVLDSLKRGDLLTLLESEQTSGYYHAQPMTRGHAGWIYRTLVRRYPGSPDVPTGGSEPAPPGTASPSGGLGEDASAYAVPNCPPEGNARSETLQALNRLKNRTWGPAPSEVTITGIQAFMSEGDDRDRWKSEDAVEVTGYVTEVKSGGPETCNCKSPRSEDHDTHIELTLGPQDQSLPMVVEVTPAWRGLAKTKGKDWSTAGLKQAVVHRWVRIRGWLFYDSQHTHNAENTNPEGEQLWRRTAWEIHPITAMEVVPSP